MTNHERYATSDESKDRADVQKGDDSVVVAARCLRAHVQRVAAIEHYKREENRRNTTPEYLPSRNTPPRIHIRRLLLRRFVWIRQHDDSRGQRVRTPDADRPSVKSPGGVERHCYFPDLPIQQHIRHVWRISVGLC